MLSIYNSYVGHSKVITAAWQIQKSCDLIKFFLFEMNLILSVAA